MCVCVCVVISVPSAIAAHLHALCTLDRFLPPDDVFLSRFLHLHSENLRNRLQVGSQIESECVSMSDTNLQVEKPPTSRSHTNIIYVFLRDVISKCTSNDSELDI